jgi:hypothetical protein
MEAKHNIRAVQGFQTLLLVEEPPDFFYISLVEEKLVELNRFNQFLRPEDRAVFDDLLTRCKLYAAGCQVFTSPVKEMSLLFWMIFAQHKKLTELGKRLNETLK